MQLANLMDSLIFLKAKEEEIKLRDHALALIVLKQLSDIRSQFLHKRLEEGSATCKWEEARTSCLRLTVHYRGQDWSIRVPVPK